MSEILRVLRSLGSGGAAANAKLMLDERRRDDWIVRTVARRVEAVTDRRQPAAAMAQTA